MYVARAGRLIHATLRFMAWLAINSMLLQQHWGPEFLLCIFKIEALISVSDSLTFLIAKVSWLTNFYTANCPSRAWFHWTSLTPWLHNTFQREKDFMCPQQMLLSCLEGSLTKKPQENTTKSALSKWYILIGWKVMQSFKVLWRYFATYQCQKLLVQHFP